MSLALETSWLSVEGGIVVTLVLVTLTSLLVGHYLYASVACRRAWKKYGVKQGSVGFDLSQSMDELLANGVDTVGVYVGTMVLITRDFRLLREILIKQFNNFPDRTNIVRTRTDLSRGLAFLRGGSWKHMRRVMSPSFSTNKMKHMSSYVHSSAQKLVSIFEACAKEDRLIEVKYTLGQYTSGIIAKTGFGLSTDCLGEQDNEFTKHCKNILKNTATKGFARLLHKVAFKLPSVNKFLIETLKVDSLDGVNIESVNYFNEILRNSIRERVEIQKGDQRKPADFLQNLVAAYVSDDESKSTKTITEADVYGQSLFTLFAAFESTASTLQFCFLLLAMNPDIQEKVYREIVEVMSPCDDTKNGEVEEEDGGRSTSDAAPTLEQLQRLRYTQAVIDETLRLHPTAPIITRYANETRTFTLASDCDDDDDTPQTGHQPETDADTSGCTTGGASDAAKKRRSQTSSASEAEPRRTRVSKTITIPAGTSVYVPIAKIQKDPRNYPDPEKFDPDRFLPENKAARDVFTFMPFGLGPRQCIGMRLAYFEIKTTMVYILRRVRLEVNDQTEPQAGGEVSFSIINGLVTNLSKPIKLAVRLRP